MKTTAKTRRVGLLVRPDDLQVGTHYAVYGIKHRRTDTHPVFGQAFQVKALNLPFLVGEIVSDPAQHVTFDIRYLDLMAVTPEYVEAQKPDVSASN